MITLDELRPMHPALIEWRRDFHRHPELGLQEYRSAKRIAERLRAWGYEVREGLAATGLIGQLRNGDGPIVMVRADMDALPIQEENAHDYASTVPGLMHACGHDAHMAIGLGVAQWMAEHRDAWHGTLLMLFQPGEEGMNGAQKMVEAGALENPRPDYFLALHVWNDMEVGNVSAAIGPVMAAADSWSVQIVGKGGHAAAPHETVDPIVIAAHTITALQSIVSRNVDPMKTAVLTVGAVEAGTAFNIIPNEAKLKGTVRTFDEAVRETVLERLREIVEGTAWMMGGVATLTLYDVAPAVVNDEKVTAIVHQAVRELLGEEHLRTDVRTMGSEDASFFMREVPGCYFFVGSSPVGGEHIPHHHPRFDIDEEALLIGAGVMINALLKLLADEAA